MWYSQMEAKIKALESEIETLKRINQINEEYFKIQLQSTNYENEILKQEIERLKQHQTEA